MNEKAPNFITQTHEGRSEVVASAASALERIYPESQFFIYDGGLSDESRERLSSFGNTVVVDWKREADFEANEGRLPARIARFESRIEDNKYLAHLYHEILGFDFTYSDVIRWNFYMRQKSRSILDLTERVEGNIVWFDDDAVVIDRFDEIYDAEFDVGVTLRSKYDELREEISPLNAGVLFFNTSSESIRTFVTEWLHTIDTLEATKHQEQIALTKLVGEADPQVYDEYYAAGDVTIDGTDISVRTFPCYRYNFAALKGGLDPDVNKILHFHGSSTLELDANMELIADVHRDDLSKWYRGDATNDTDRHRGTPRANQ